MIMKEIHGFDSPQHFSEFLQEIHGAVEKGYLTPVPVEQPYGSLMFEETWYRADNGEIWRVVSPDFPFRGIFEKIKLIEELRFRDPAKGGPSPYVVPQET